MNTLNKILVTVILAFIPTAVSYAQTISVAPTSIGLWGKTPYISSVSFEYKGVGLHYFASGKDQIYWEKELVSMYSGIGISYMHQIRFLRAGILATPLPMPISTASRLNAVLEVELKFKGGALVYRHISNGFGLFHHTNPGLDQLMLRIGF